MITEGLLANLDNAAEDLSKALAADDADDEVRDQADSVLSLLNELFAALAVPANGKHAWRGQHAAPEHPVGCHCQGPLDACCSPRHGPVR